MSTAERLLHMVLFEGIAVFLSMLGLLLFTNIEIHSALQTMIALSLIAMVWNYIFNIGFDKIFIGKREERSWKLRISYALLFESGLVFLTTPVMAYILQVSLLEAFILDIGLTLFILLYTLIFNYAYDHLRAQIIKSHEVQTLV